jgi:type II secretory pathway pseudopilin PulG
MLHPSSRRAFTLIEMMLAIAIAIAVVILAIPNMRGFSAEKRLRETFEKFDALTRKAQINAVREQRSWTLTWQKNRIVLSPDEPTPEERDAIANAGGNAGADTQREELLVSQDEVYAINRHAALLAPKDTPGVWTFWRSGTCEPVIVSYEGPYGTWSAQYDPLTGHGEITDELPR